MTDKFERCHEITAKWEGGWSDHPADPGGKTNWGVTQATLSTYLGRPATADEIRALTMREAIVIYRQLFWRKVGGDALPAGVDLCVYDFGVNSGPERSVRSLQAALGVTTDGWVGELTADALRNANVRQLINTLCDRRLEFLKSCRDRKTGKSLWPTFGKGWSNRVADIRQRALAMAGAANQIVPIPAPGAGAGTAKAIPPAPVEKTVSTEQKIAGTAAGAAVVTTTLGPVAGFWRDNKDVLTDPLFLGVAAILTVVILFLLFRKAPAVEEQA